MKLSILILFFPFCAAAQITLRGTVSNRDGGEPIPFATIALLKENTGINADANGDFLLQSNSPKIDDTLIVSSVGFTMEKVPLAGLTQEKIDIRLSRLVPQLEPLLIQSDHKMQSAELNKFSGCGNHFFGSAGYLQQLARHFQVPRPHGRLTKVRICAGFMNRRSFFRLRVYDLDTSTGGPGADLVDTTIEVRTKKAIVKLNLEKYNIRIPGKDFFIGVEWIKVAENEDSLRNPINNHYVTYRPSIGSVPALTGEYESWTMNYNSNWHRFSGNKPFDHELLISATVKY